MRRRRGEDGWRRGGEENRRGMRRGGEYRMNRGGIGRRGEVGEDLII